MYRNEEAQDRLSLTNMRAPRLLEGPMWRYRWGEEDGSDVGGQPVVEHPETHSKLLL